MVVWSEFRGWLYMYSLGIYMYIYAYLDLEFSFFLPFFLAWDRGHRYLEQLLFIRTLDHSILYSLNYYIPSYNDLKIYMIRGRKC